MFENAIVIVLIILIINVVYVTFSTIRMILTLKGRRYLAAFVSTFEVVIYIIGLGLVLDNLNAIQNIIAYAVGYAIGIIVGSKIEEKLALGYITVNVVSSNPDIQFTKKLRDQGYGVTSWTSHGMEGDRVSMQILTPRKYELQLYESIKQLDPKAFIISYEPKRIHGGFWVKQVRSGRLLRRKSGDQTVANSEPNGQSSSNISVGDLSAHATPTPLVGEVQAEVKQENDQEQSKE